MPDHDHEHDHDHDEEIGEALEEALELDTQSQIFLEMRRQNLDLLKIAADVAGFGGSRPPVKPNELKTALRAIWDVYSEFYAWVDPEETEGDDDEDDEL